MQGENDILTLEFDAGASFSCGDDDGGCTDGRRANIFSRALSVDRMFTMDVVVMLPKSTAVTFVMVISLACVTLLLPPLALCAMIPADARLIVFVDVGTVGVGCVVCGGSIDM